MESETRAWLGKYLNDRVKLFFFPATGVSLEYVCLTKELATEARCGDTCH